MYVGTAFLLQILRLEILRYHSDNVRLFAASFLLFCCSQKHSIEEHVSPAFFPKYSLFRTHFITFVVSDTPVR
jgi:hypothetical protein